MTANEHGVAGSGVGGRGAGARGGRVRLGRFGRAWVRPRSRCMQRAAQQPAVVGAAWQRFLTSVAAAGPVAAARWLGVEAPPPVAVPDGDKRFADKTWTDNPAFFALRQGYLATSQLVSDLLEAGSGDATDDAKARLAAGFLVDAIAPTNFLLTNPAALKRAFETSGASVAAGARQFADDLVNNNGRPRQVDTRPFHVGENLAATPGKVVFKNDLMELIQYAPQTKQVRARSRCWPARPGSTSTTSWTWPRAAASWSGRCSTSAPCSRSPTATRTSA